MDLSNLKPAVGSVKHNTRIGRGPGSGKGFKNINRVEYKAINLDLIDALAEAKNLSKVGIEELRAAGYIRRGQLVKILANGAVKRAITVEANAFSAAAQAAIEAAGGTAQKL